MAKRNFRLHFGIGNVDALLQAVLGSFVGGEDSR